MQLGLLKLLEGPWRSTLPLWGLFPFLENKGVHVMFLTLVMSVLWQSVWKTNLSLTVSDKARKWASRLRNPTFHTTVFPEKGGPQPSSQARSPCCAHRPQTAAKAFRNKASKMRVCLTMPSGMVQEGEHGSLGVTRSIFTHDSLGELLRTLFSDPPPAFQGSHNHKGH